MLGCRKRRRQPEPGPPRNHSVRSYENWMPAVPPVSMKRLRVPILPQWQPRHGIVHAVSPSRRGPLPAVRALIDYLAERFEALEEP